MVFFPSQNAKPDVQNDAKEADTSENQSCDGNRSQREARRFFAATISREPGYLPVTSPLAQPEVIQDVGLVR